MKVMAPVALPMWAGYRAGRRGERPSNGRVEVIVHGDRVLQSQRRALDEVSSFADAMKGPLLDAIIQAHADSHRGARPRAKITPASLRRLVALDNITVLRDRHRGSAYVAYLFECAWTSSSVVVVAHRDRVVCVGGLEALAVPVRDPARKHPAPRRVPPARRRAARARAREAAKKNPRDLTRRTRRNVVLPTWAAFRAGANAPLSKGVVSVRVGEDPGARSPITPAQRSAFRAIVREARPIQVRLLDAIAAAYPAAIAAFEPARADLPASVDRRTLADLVDLQSVQIHDVEKDGFAYTGYVFACDWEPEHGLGVLLHGARVVEIGGADAAMLTWIAERDAASPDHRPAG